MIKEKKKAVSSLYRLCHLTIYLTGFLVRIHRYVSLTHQDVGIEAIAIEGNTHRDAKIKLDAVDLHHLLDGGTGSF